MNVKFVATSFTMKATARAGRYFGKVILKLYKVARLLVMGLRIPIVRQHFAPALFCRKLSC